MKTLAIVFALLFAGYTFAAEPTDPGEQFDLALMYYIGEGVPQDYAEAVKWLRKAADQAPPEPISAVQR